MIASSRSRALRTIAPIRKHWQRAFGFANRSTTARYYSGEWPSPVTHVIRTLDTLARCAGCNPWPLLVEGIVTVTQAEISAAGTPALEARLEEVTDMAFTRTANAHRMAMHGHREDQAVADIAAAELLLERAAIQRELAERERHH